MTKINKIHLSLSPVKRVMTGVLIGLLVVAGVFSTHGFGAFAASCSSQADCQQQIDTLNAQNNDAQNSLAQLEAQAGSYQAAISSLQAQIDALNSQIASNQAQQVSLQAQIDAAQAELDRQKAGLAQDVKAMYVTGQLSTVEMLATSKNLSDFVDASTYATAVQNKIQSTVVQVATLQNQLKEQKAQLGQLLSALSAQQQQQSQAQAEQTRLLSLNESQQASFNQQIASNQSQVAQLKKQQAALIQAGTTAVIPPPSGGNGGACDSGGGNGNYPMSWCDAAQDSIDTIPPYSQWDLNNRECTSYAYWYFTQKEGFTDFTASGNAKYWAATSNYPTHTNPLRGSIAVETTGTYGHVAIVQGLPGDTYWGGTVPAGYVLVSEMNYDFAGHFRYSFSPIGKFSAYIY